MTECRMYDSRVDIDGLTGLEDFFLIFNPLFELSFQNDDDFFLLRVVVKITAVARINLGFDNDQLFRTGNRASDPSQTARATC